MNKQFIITNFAAFALMLFLPTGCRQADGKQDAVQSYRVIKVAASPVEISESYSAAIRGRQDGHPAANIRAHYPSESERG
jgi:membrane fusion protein (multidrug efflux system)